MDTSNRTIDTIICARERSSTPYLPIINCRNFSFIYDIPFYPDTTACNHMQPYITACIPSIAFLFMYGKTAPFWISSYLLISDLSRTISRVMSKLQQATVGMIIYLGRLLPAASSNLPKAGGPRQRFCSVLLRMGFTYAPSVTREAVVSYTALPPLPGIYRAVYFCCTILRVASTGRYPASCPVKPGLSSPR